MINVSRLDFESLLDLQDVLDERLVREEITLEQYESEWATLLSMTGYTKLDYESMIDRRFDEIIAGFPGRKKRPNASC